MAPSIIIAGNSIGRVPGGGIAMQAPAVSAPAASIDNQTIAEADGTVTLTVTMSPTPTSAVSVDFATRDGSAVAGSDYTANSGTLNFGIGVATQPVVISITDDPDVETSENFFVDLSNPVGCTIADGEGEVTVTSADVAFVADAVNFDGATALAYASPTSVADSSQFTCSFFVKPDPFDGTFQDIIGPGFGRGVRVGFDGTGLLRVIAQGVGGAARLDESSIVQLVFGVWNFVAISIDLNNVAASRVFHNSSDVGHTFSLTGSGDFGFSETTQYNIGALLSSGSFSFAGDLAEVRLSLGEFIDLDANIDQFISANGTPVSQAGNPGYVYHSGGPASFATNLGTAGQPTVTGALGQGTLPVQHPVTLHNWTETNTDGALASTGFIRRGLAFEKGDAPAGSIPDVTVDGTPLAADRAAFMETNSWSDGSLRKVTLVADVGAFTAGQAKAIELKVTPGVQGASGVDPFAYLQANTDLKVEVTNHSGTTTGGQPNRTYSLNIAALATSRREIQADNPVCVRAFVWGAPGTEKHLMCLHYADLWLDSGGTVQGVEWTPVMSQHWWVDDPFGDGAATKEERNYDAAILDGVTPLEQHSGLNHAYYCQWAALRTANDDQHAKRLWIDKGAAMPTLRLEYSLDSKRRMIRSGALPPLKQGVTYTVTHTQTSHAPLGEGTGNTSHNHREAYNGTGGYEGRGVISNMDAVAMVEQTAVRWRVARVSAQAGLSAFFHVRDHRTASGGAFDGDVSMGLIPPLAEQLGAQTYVGLAGEVSAVTDGGGSLAEVNPAAATNAQHSTGSFVSWDDAHHIDPAFFMAFVEGERYLADAVLSSFDYAAIREGNYNPFGRRPGVQFSVVGADTFYAARAAAFSLPTDRFGSTWKGEQERSLAWITNAANHASILTPDSDRHRVLIDRQLEHHSRWIEDGFGVNNVNWPAGHIAKGGFRHQTGSNPSNVNSPWMNNFNPLVYYQAAIYAEDQGWGGFKRLADQAARMPARMWETPYAAVQYRAAVTRDLDSLDFLPADEHYSVVDGAVMSGNTLTFTMPSLLTLTENDAIYFSQNNTNGNDQTILSGASFGTKYFAVNVSGSSCQLSLTASGPPETISNGTIAIAIFAQDFAATPAGVGGRHLPTADTFAGIAFAAAEMTHGSNLSLIDGALIADVRAWTSTMVFDTFANWNYDAELMK